VDKWGKRIIYAPCGTEWDGATFNHASENSMQFKSYELFFSGIFHLVFYMTLGN
jgi:hypothetical protein